MHSIFNVRSFRLAAAALTSVALAGCLDTTGTGEEDEPVIAGVILAAAPGSEATGSTTVTTGGQAGTLTLRAGTMNALTVHVVGPDAEDEPVVKDRAEEFEIRLRLGDVPLMSTIGASYPYQFSVLPEGTGAQTYIVVVRHIGHGDEFLAEMDVIVEAAGGA